MSSFTEPLRYQRLSDRSQLYVLTKGFVFYLSDSQSGDHVYVPEGTIFNGASIPAVAKLITGWDALDERWIQASVVHDALVGEWCSRVRVYYKGEYQTLTWHQSADWFAKALEVRTRGLRFRRLQRYIIVAGVKLYGLLARKN